MMMMMMMVNIDDVSHISHIMAYIYQMSYQEAFQYCQAVHDLRQCPVVVGKHDNIVVSA